MINPENIPIEAIETAKSAYTAEIYRGHGTAREFHKAMAAAIAAAVSGWPGIERIKKHESSIFNDGGIILPLPQGSD